MMTGELQAQAFEIEQKIAPSMERIERIVESNQWRVLDSFRKHRVSDIHFSGSTGYGYNDLGREVLEQIYADVFGAEAALVRPHIVSGTHAISTALFGLLRPGDHLLSATGTPYDTLQKVIGHRDADKFDRAGGHERNIEGKRPGTLADWGIDYDEVDLLPDGSPDVPAIVRALRPETKVVAVQRSRGYSSRRSLFIQDLRNMVHKIKQVRPDVIVFVDNCYGEFAEQEEPPHAGADLIAGSLIKNPGGGIAPSGGYIAGRSHLVEQCANQLTAPGLGTEVGAMLGTVRSMYQGLFLAPHVVGQAIRGSVFAAALFEQIGIKTDPHWSEPRTDLIQAIHFGHKENLIQFVQSVQAFSPVDSHVTPIPSSMPGYEHPVIMAAGTFIQGGSLELSADAPVRPPYTVYMQGGLTYAHVKYVVLNAVSKLNMN